MDIRTLAPGEQVTQNGIYHIPIERYHHDRELCDGPSISSTGLRAIMDCPAKYWATSPYNPKRRTPAPKQHFMIGKAAHSMILEGELPESQFAISPYDAFRTNEAKEWRDEQLAAGKSILKETDLTAIHDMHEALAADPMIKAGLFEGMVECSLIWKDEATGIWLRSRPDVIPNNDTLADAKFVADSSPKAIRRALAEYRYNMQFALGVEGMRVVLGRAIQNCAIVACEKSYPHVVTVAAIDDKAMDWGLRLNRVAIDQFAERMKTNDWPGYDAGAVTVGLPAYEVKRLEAMGAAIPETVSA